MKLAVFSAKPYDEQYLTEAAKGMDIELDFFEARLTRATCPLANGYEAICCFVNDHLNAGVLLTLKQQGVKLIAMRCAGFNNVDLAAARDLEIQIVRVPAYSPDCVAEHAVGLILQLNRKFNRASSRVREGNFSLEGLMGFEMRGRTVGVIGMGKIGQTFAKIMLGFGCNVIAFDVNPSGIDGVTDVSLDDLLKQSDIISLHCPLLSATHHIINSTSIAKMKPGVMIINTSRGGLVNTPAVIEGLKTGQIGYLGLDVYEQEDAIFFEDRSDEVLQDDVFARLLTFPNVMVTSHQAFFTEEAMQTIAQTTMANLAAWREGEELVNEVIAPAIKV